MPTGYPKNGINNGWFKKGENLGKNHPRWTGKIDGFCVICGKSFKQYPSGIRKCCSKECLSIHSSAMRMGRNNPAWKGENISYNKLHDWIRKELGSPTKCTYCGKNDLTGKQIHWANKSGLYKRELTDWIRLCVLCHKRYDLKKIKL